MSRRQLILLPLLAAAIIAASYVGYVRGRASGNEASIDQLVADTADQPSPEDAMAFWSARVAANPKAYIDLTNLGDANLREARATGDLAAYQRAEQAYRDALAINPKYYQASNGLASTLFSVHEFEQARAVAEPLTTDGRNLTAIALIGDIDLALGDYDGADAAYTRVEQTPGATTLDARRSQLAWLRGDPPGAIQLMAQATASADVSGDYRENLAWYRFQLGDLEFKSGNLDAAEQQFNDALKIQGNYYYALAGLGRVAAARGDYKQAIDFYSRSVAIVPLPDILAELGDIYAITGDTANAQQQYDTVEFIGKLAEINQVVYNRQLSLFYSNHGIQLDVALDLAKRELEVRKDVYGYDAYAWALYKNGRYADAEAAMQQALRLGTHDAMLLYHAGMIQDALGNHDEARDLLQQALKLNPGFDVLQAQVARDALKQLG